MRAEQAALAAEITALHQEQETDAVRCQRVGWSVMLTHVAVGLSRARLSQQARERGREGRKREFEEEGQGVRGEWEVSAS